MNEIVNSLGSYIGTHPIALAIIFSLFVAWKNNTSVFEVWLNGFTPSFLKKHKKNSDYQSNKKDIKK